ncbi:hypothetical protein JCM5350_004698 [Sporobolomyces pararoseus]
MAFSFPSTASSTPSSNAPILEKEDYELDTPYLGGTTDESTSFLPPSHSRTHSPSLSNSITPNHSRNGSILGGGGTGPPGGWWNAVSRRFAQRNFTRRALLVGMLSLVVLVTLVSSTVTNREEGEEDGWYSSWSNALSNFASRPEESDSRSNIRELDLLKVLNYETPQDTLASQMKEGVRYATAMSYGGHANQMISIQKLLYFSKITNRVPIIPSLIPVHIDGGPQNISTFYDLPLFYHLTSLPALEMSQVKSSSFWSGEGTKDIQEEFPCWSIQEGTVGFPNREAISFDMHGLFVHHWPLPAKGFARGAGGFDLSFDALRIWDSSPWEKDRWIERVRREYLPQQERKNSKGEVIQEEIDVEDEEARKENIKVGFTPRESPAPTDQMVAFDNSLFLGPIMFPPINLSPDTEPLEPGLAGEGTSWSEIGQHLHFTPLVEQQATSYLLKLFEVEKEDDIPPFITIHLRRGDFKEFTGAYTDLEKYTTALDRLLPRLQSRLDNSTSFSGPGRTPYRHLSRSKLRASSYSIVATTDESSSSPFVQKVRELGWKVVDHELLKTKEELGGWWPTLLDCAILARGRSFIGTDKSTYSNLAALRVKYWNGGVVETA